MADIRSTEAGTWPVRATDELLGLAAFGLEQGVEEAGRGSSAPLLTVADGGRHAVVPTSLTDPRRWREQMRAVIAQLPQSVSACAVISQGGVTLDGVERDAAIAACAERDADVGLLFAQCYELGEPVRSIGPASFLAEIEQLFPADQARRTDGYRGYVFLPADAAANLQVAEAVLARHVPRDRTRATTPASRLAEMENALLEQVLGPGNATGTVQYAVQQLIRERARVVVRLDGWDLSVAFVQGERVGAEIRALAPELLAGDAAADPSSCGDARFELWSDGDPDGSRADEYRWVLETLSGAFRGIAFDRSRELLIT